MMDAFIKKPTADTRLLLERHIKWLETQAAGLEEGRFKAVHGGVDVSQHLAANHRKSAAEGRALLAKNNSD
jgi:hypothetical protein